MGKVLWDRLQLFYDFDPCTKTVSGRHSLTFHNCKKVAKRIRKDTPPGRVAVVLLTDKWREPAFRMHPHEGPTVVFVVNVDKMADTWADPVDTARGREAPAEPVDEEAMALLKKLKDKGANFDAFLKDELSARIVLEWTAANPERVRSLAALVASLEDKELSNLTPFALEVLSALGGSLTKLEEFARKAPHPGLDLGAAAATYARQFLAIEDLERMIEADETEPVFQKFFEEHHWMFGCHYVRRIERRTLVVGSQYDIVLAGTDGYIDIIELKRPGFGLFREDTAHDCLQPSSDLAQVLGQAQHYILKADSQIHIIRDELKVPAHRVRAIIIIGSSKKDGGDDRRRALRTLNGHLSRIEVRTFSDILESAKAIQRHTRATLLSPEVPPSEPEGDVVEVRPPPPSAAHPAAPSAPS
ncbi:MAG: DUF4263 domain-containing protein [Pseudomonadota bacterium]|nr:DUF4263 domain-containing protein [Pseudomonadota bacterium]